MSLNNQKNSTYIVLGIAALFIVIIMFQFMTSGQNSPYSQALLVERTQKDGDFRTSGNSPIPEAERSEFTGLTYFPPNAIYRVSASLEPAAGNDTLVLTTSKGSDRKLLNAGVLNFTLQGKAQKLTAFRYIEGSQNVLFVPFSDMSSGKTTYEGGRYIEIPVEAGKTIYIDFNRAYNPYCVYNPTFVCPLPPLENSLRLEILAGEKYTEK